MKKTFFLLLSVAFMMLSFLSANAQIDLNKLGKKAKEKIENKKEQGTIEKEEVDNKVKQGTIEKEEDIVAKPVIAEQDNKGGDNNKKKYTPSAKAISADPKAEDQTVESGFTKSISEIHAAYEQLDPEVFTYQPYYEYKEFYYLHDKADENFRVREFNSIVAKLATLSPGGSYIMTYFRIKTPDGNLLVTSDEFFRNAWTALFVADPMSSEAFDKFTKALMFDNQMFESKLRYEMDDPDKGIVYEKTGELLIAPSRNDYENRQDSREEAALSLARNVVSMDYVRTYLKELLKQCSTETDALMKYKLYWQSDAVIKEIFRKHKNYKASDAANRQIEASYSAIDSQSLDIEANARLSNAKPVEMPKGVQVDGATSAKVNGLAKEMLGDEYVKTIYLSNKWSEFKEDKYPYRVMHLSLPVTIIVKRGDKYLMNYYDVTKSPNGGSWNMMVKMGSSFQPVNYK